MSGVLVSLKERGNGGWWTGWRSQLCRVRDRGSERRRLFPPETLTSAPSGSVNRGPVNSNDLPPPTTLIMPAQAKLDSGGVNLMVCI